VIPHMTTSLILAIDQGTHQSRAMLVDNRGRICASSSMDIGLTRMDAKTVIQNPEAILHSVQRTVNGALAQLGKLGQMVGAGMATQRSSIVAWDKQTGRALSPVISWQDRRADRWMSEFGSNADRVKHLTGLPLSAHYGAGKLRWLMDNVPNVKSAYRRGDLAWGPLASFLVHHLVQGSPYVVDDANAQRTLLWNLSSRQWDPWLCELFQIPSASLPECRPISCAYGPLKTSEIPLVAVNGDQTAAFCGLGRPDAHTALINMGSGAFVLFPTGNKPFHHEALLSGIFKSDHGSREYVLEGTVNGAGTALTWAMEKWRMPDLFRDLPAWLFSDDDVPVFINAVGGLGSPWWRTDISSHLVGDGAPWQRAVAVVESIIFLLQANIDTMRSLGADIRRLNLTGGLSALDGLCQKLANLSQTPVYRPAETEATIRGISWQAFGEPRFWPKPGRGRHFTPVGDSDLHERYVRFSDMLKLILGESA